MVKPVALYTGDTVGIIVPASPVKESYRDRGLGKIKEMGYVPVEVEDILSRNDFLAKPTEESFADLQRFSPQKRSKPCGPPGAGMVPIICCRYWKNWL
jgi:muramoyltetrapeptide carboxypeptidase LdcA involved in peptidoglycan recycling